MSPIGSDNKSSSSSSSQDESMPVSQNNAELARLLKLYIQTKKNLMENVLRDEQNHNDYKANEDDGDDENDDEENSNDDADYETDTFLNKRSAPRRIFIGKRSFRMPVYHPEDDAESYMDKRAQIHRVFIGKRKLAHDIKRIFIG